MKENIIINLDKSGKTFKRINIRYDKSSKNYFIYSSSFKNYFKRTFLL